MSRQNMAHDGPILKLAFLWHQHQPYYKDLLSGRYLMPWVRLHGVKDYLDMVEILKDYPSIKQTFNMVPSLLEQISDYARKDALDPHLELSMKNAAALNHDDKKYILDLFFQANYENMIFPYRRFESLYRRRNMALAKWGEQDWRDLQCLSNLAWIDPMFKKAGRMKELALKGERYTEKEKHEILSKQQRIISRIIPALKERMEQGQIEVSISPYFHPIMPLLYDTSVALIAMPNAALPRKRFAHPEDVDRQVSMAVDMYTDLFGRPPRGLWPSEGSVSEDIIPILRDHGIEWIATDEEILAESLGVPARTLNGENLITSGKLYCGYEFHKDHARITIFFRDHALSDNIGFVYSQQDPERAADDFISRLATIRKNLKNIADPIVAVILDGENAWEYFANDGHDFLRALYTKIADARWIETTTFSGYLSSKPENQKLNKLFPGSWINHNFSVWIGHDEDNIAWDMLSQARDELEDFQKTNPGFDKQKVDLAWKEIYIAEGSDWCWWFGDDHVGPNNDEFDRVYRSHLANVYRITDREPPPELFKPIRTDFMLAHVSRPIDYITPTIDGMLTQYYEWQQAGFFDCLKAGSTMHKSENLIAGIWFGYDHDNLYFRIDRGITINDRRFRDFEFELEFLEPKKEVLSISKSIALLKSGEQKPVEVEYVLKQILEFSIPLSIFEPFPYKEKKISFRLLINEKGKRRESWPISEAINLTLPQPGSDQIPWMV